MQGTIAVIGAGNVGLTTAFLLASHGLGSIVLVDIDEEVTRGKALDLQHATAFFGHSISIKGTSDYSMIQGASLAIITAGFPRKPGMSRDDLLEKNCSIVATASKHIRQYCPSAIVIVVTNPLDVMTYACLSTTGFPPHKVVGMAGVLDTLRLKAHVGEALHISPNQIEAMIIGTHGDDMVCVNEKLTANGKPLKDSLQEDKIHTIISRVQKSGAEVVGLLKTGSAYLAPASATFSMAKAILNDQKIVLPCCCFLDGQYGISGICIGVPAVLGKKGIEEIKEILLSHQEKEQFKKSAEHIREETEKVKAILTRT